MHKKILILSEAFGSGHTKVAEALAQGISLQEPSVHTEIIEIGRKLHPMTNGLALLTYKQMITICPYLWTKIYRNLSGRDQATPSWLQFVIHQLFHRNIENVLEQTKPNLVICTHPFSSSSLSRLKKMGYPISICTVITDFHAHRGWIQHEVDLYIVSSDEVRRQLINSGILKHRIAVTGSQGSGTFIIKWKDSIQIIICTGNNHSLRISLEHNKHFQHPHIRIVGFVDFINKLLDAADLLFTKPGGLTCFEALSKGVPMLIYQPIPGHEEYNCDHLVQHELAIRIHHGKEVDRWIENLLSFPNTFKRFFKNIEQFQEQLNPLAGTKAVLDLLFHQRV